ncbi:hypothetical protein Tco_0849791 [Tanacetum coccineum]
MEVFGICLGKEHVLLYVARAARKENEDDIDEAIVGAHADLKRHYCIYIAPNNLLWISSTFRINFSLPVRRAISNAVSIIAQYVVLTEEWPDLQPFWFQSSHYTSFWTYE